MKNWKTTVGGLLSAIGKGLSGGGVLVQLTQLFPNNKVPPSILLACWWIALTGVVLSIVGIVWTAFFAADAATVNNIAAAVDKINQAGPDSGTAILSKTNTPAAPAQPNKT